MPTSQEMEEREREAQKAIKGTLVNLRKYVEQFKYPDHWDSRRLIKYYILSEMLALCYWEYWAKFETRPDYYNTTTIQNWEGWNKYLPDFPYKSFETMEDPRLGRGPGCRSEPNPYVVGI